MRLFCVVTIDTEPDCSTTWARSVPLTFSSVTDAIPKIFRPLWERYAVRPVYLVSPEVVEQKKCCEILQQERAAGAEIGTHLHGEYIVPEKKHEVYDGTRSSAYPCFEYRQVVEHDKIANLTQMIQENIGVRPTSYRAARFGADEETMESLAQLGYRVDSSVTPHIDWSPQGGPDFRRFKEQPYKTASGILEVPVTIGGRRLPFLSQRWISYQWLRPTLMTALEMKRLVSSYEVRYRGQESLVLCMMFHSMEVVPRATPYVRSPLGARLFLRRLEGILKYLQQRGYSFISLQDVVSLYDADQEAKL